MDKFLRYYLPLSVRLGSYTANHYFLSVINPAFDQLVPNPFLRNLSYFLFSAFVFELIWKTIDKFYHPRFVSKRNNHQASQFQKEIVLSRVDYEYRIRYEKLIFSLLLYFLFNLIISLSVYGLMDLKIPISRHIGLGLAGGFLAIFHFFGLVALSISAQIKQLAFRIFVLIWGFLVMAPEIFFIIYTFATEFAGSRWIGTF